MRLAAESTAAHGASLAEKAGLCGQHGGGGGAYVDRHRCGSAKNSDASLIVLGPHRRSGLVGHLQGSVAAAVIAHSTIPVMAIAEQPCRR